jgi:2',3'-cyclic-nucleotide 2'-phosphodiesterase
MSNLLKVLMVGDIVGSPGRMAFARTVTRMKQAGEVDFAIVNAENAASGRGLTAALGQEILAAGADIITLGDHTWDQKGFQQYLDEETRVLRPANFAPGCPGHGHVTVDTGKGRVTVINLVGRVFLQPADCPFRKADEILKKEQANIGKMIFVDVHAEATSEKIVLGRYLDGRVSCVVGTHTHVQTSDDRILPKGTAYITDLGMTGSRDSAIGRDLETITARFLTGMPGKFAVATEDVLLEGVIVEVDPATGKAVTIKRVRQEVPAAG